MTKSSNEYGKQDHGKIMPQKDDEEDVWGLTRAPTGVWASFAPTGGGGYPPPQRSPKLYVLAIIKKSVRKLLSSSTIFTEVILRPGQY